MKLLQSAFVGICLYLAILNPIVAQKEITLDDIWKNYTFRQKSIQNFNWTKDGQSYTELKDGKIYKYSVADPNKSEVLFDQSKIATSEGKKISMQEFSFSKDEQKILISTEVESIYRRSTKEINYIFDIKTQKLSLLSKGGKQMHATFSPDGNFFAIWRPLKSLRK